MVAVAATAVAAAVAVATAAAAAVAVATVVVAAAVAATAVAVAVIAVATVAVAVAIVAATVAIAVVVAAAAAVATVVTVAVVAVAAAVAATTTAATNGSRPDARVLRASVASGDRIPIRRHGVHEPCTQSGQGAFSRPVFVCAARLRRSAAGRPFDSDGDRRATASAAAPMATFRGRCATFPGIVAA